MTCPYCGTKIGHSVDIETGLHYRQLCPHSGCMQWFVYFRDERGDYHSEQADCLNRGEHAWLKICGVTAWEVCGICGETRRV